ncbi:MAG: radical SAM protein [Elusimicrobiales bacterium]|nr:radical SAM protein [Elusimicrobiales bacterium]
MENRDCYEILLNYKCNINCSFCSQGDYDRSLYMSKEDIFKEIYKAKKAGYKKLGLSGGEPTIRKDLVEIIKFAKKTGFKFIRIQTNGLALSDYNFAKELKEAGLTFCKFSLTSNDPKIHDMLTGVKNSYQKVIKAIGNMKRLKIRIGNNILINKYNYDKLPEIIEFLLDMGVSNFVVIYPIYTGNMLYNHKKIGISLGKCEKFFIRAIEIMSENNMTNEILFLNVPPCFLKGYEENLIGISAFNTVVKSPHRDLINLDDRTNSNKIRGDVCKKCVFKTKCDGVDKEYVKIFGWEGFEPIHKKSEKKKIYFTDDEKCLLEILKKGKGKMQVEQIIKLSKKVPLCQSCQDANNVINAATSLSVKKIVEIEFKKGKYYFSLL